MPKKPKYEKWCSSPFSWRLSRRGGVWYADGRSNLINVGRHSLGTRDKAEAMEQLRRLDEACAVKFGFIKEPTRRSPTGELALAEGRRLYEEHGSRSPMVGGLKPASVIRYRSTFNKFIPWATKAGITFFQQITKSVLEQYVAHLEKLGRAQKTILNELTTIKQCIDWLIEAGHLADCEPIQLKLRKPESERAYYNRPVEVAAMLEHCKQRPELRWLGDTILALASTGMRIDELINLKWSDVDLEGERITLTE